MYSVNIKYYGVAAESTAPVMPICPVFVPTGSYIDSEAYKDSVLASNVEGWGKLGFTVDPEVGVPFPSGIHNINMAKVGTAGEDEKGAYTEVEFTVESYKDYIFYKTMAAELAAEGFVITVGDGATSEDEAADATGDEEPNA